MEFDGNSERGGYYEQDNFIYNDEKSGFIGHTDGNGKFAKVRPFHEHSCTILSSFKIVIIFNNTPADFVLISADVLLKKISILKELRMAAKVCSKNERTLSSTSFERCLLT